MPERPDQNAGAIELSVIGAAVVALLLAQLAITNTFSLLSQPLWLDECLTQLLSNDPSFSHEISALKAGVDTMPPTYYLILRIVKPIAGTLGAVELRAISLLAIVLAAVGVYAICRRFFDRTSSLVGMLIILSHQAVVEEMFQARQYAIWLAAVVWFCCFQIDATKSRRKLILACICAVLVTTLHWLGIILIASIGVTDFVLHRSIKRAIPMICGIAAMLACIPFLLGQRAGLNPPTWIDPISLSDIRDVIRHLFAGAPVIAVILAFWIWTVAGRERDETRRDLRELAPLSALLAFPFILAGLSRIVQPMLLMRYVVPAIVPLAPLAGELSSRLGKSARIALIVVLAILGAGELRNLNAVGEIASARIAAAALAIDEIAQHQGPLPVVVIRRLELYPTIALRPELAADAAQLRFDQPLPFELKLRTRYEQVMGARVHAFYDRYQMIDYSKLEAMKHFFVVSPPEDADEDIKKLFAGAKIQQRGPALFEITWP